MDIQQLVQRLSGSFEPAQAEKLALAIYEMVQSLYERQLLVHIDALSQQLRDFERRMIERFEALESQTQRNTEAIAQLAEQTQRNTEAIAQLAEQTQRNTEAIAALSEQTQRNTEAIAQLVKEARRSTERLDRLEKQVGGLSITVGFTLENEAYKALPALLERDYGLKVIGRLKRDYAVDMEGNEYEVNILGEAQRDGEVLTIVGESKVQLSKQDIDRFIRRKLKPLQRIYDRIFPVLVTHMITSRGVDEYAREKGIALYFSYDF